MTSRRSPLYPTAGLYGDLRQVTQETYGRSTEHARGEHKAALSLIEKLLYDQSLFFIFAEQN